MTFGRGKQANLLALLRGRIRRMTGTQSPSNSILIIILPYTQLLFEAPRGQLFHETDDNGKIWKRYYPDVDSIVRSFLDTSSFSLTR